MEIERLYQLSRALGISLSLSLPSFVVARSHHQVSRMALSSSSSLLSRLSSLSWMIVLLFIISLTITTSSTSTTTKTIATEPTIEIEVPQRPSTPSRIPNEQLLLQQLCARTTSALSKPLPDITAASSSELLFHVPTCIEEHLRRELPPPPASAAQPLVVVGWDFGAWEAHLRPLYHWVMNGILGDVSGCSIMSVMRSPKSVLGERHVILVMQHMSESTIQSIVAAKSSGTLHMIGIILTHGVCGTEPPAWSNVVSFVLYLKPCPYTARKPQPSAAEQSGGPSHDASTPCPHVLWVPSGYRNEPSPLAPYQQLPSSLRHSAFAFATDKSHTTENILTRLLQSISPERAQHLHAWTDNRELEYSEYQHYLAQSMFTICADLDLYCMVEALDAGSIPLSSTHEIDCCNRTAYDTDRSHTD